LYELRLAVAFFPVDARILEIGAGAGWQSEALSSWGYSVDAIDLDTSRYADARVSPVKTYDGKTIPFDSNSFDVVFSSNVLEHIADVEIFQAEIRRVLKPDGVAVHLMPTPAWRLWASVSHYCSLVAASVRRVGMRSSNRWQPNPREQHTMPIQPAMVRRMLVPPPHGEYRSSFSELWYFSRLRWLKLFRRTGWIVLEARPTHLFYAPLLTAHGLPGIRLAHYLSYVLGSACLLYVLRIDPVADRADLS
jgi:SAM-dependent methyltransferase